MSQVPTVIFENGENAPDHVEGNRMNKIPLILRQIQRLLRQNTEKLQQILEYVQTHKKVLYVVFHIYTQCQKTFKKNIQKSCTIFFILKLLIV